MKILIKILFNCTTNVEGGGCKNAAIFIRESLDDKSITYIYAVSPQVLKIINSFGINIDERFILFEKSPSKSISSRKKLLKLSSSDTFDAIYTMAGPAYVSFKIPHIMGMSNPYVSHLNILDFLRFSTLKSIPKSVCNIVYQCLYANKADHFIFQTLSSKKGFEKRFRISSKNTCIIPNALDLQKYDIVNDATCSYFNNKVTNIFVPAGPYLHKCVHLIPFYANELRKRGLENFCFITTLPDHFFKQFIKSNKYYNSVKDLIVNTGHVSYINMKSFYRTSDVVFIPSALETFSATYIEALVDSKCVVVADKDFARDVCLNNAFYVNPFDFTSVSDMLTRIILNPNEHKINNFSLNKSIIINHKSRYELIKNEFFLLLD